MLRVGLGSLVLAFAAVACAAPRVTGHVENTPAAQPERTLAAADAHVDAARAPARPVVATTPPKMRVHFVDVGQGAATLFEFPHDAVLVDTGGETNGLNDSNAELLSYLAAFFGRRSDLNGVLTSLIITHPHIDHTRGILDVVNTYHPRNIVTNGMTTGSGSAQQKWLHNYAADHESGTGAVHFEAVRLANIPKATGLHDGVIDPVGGTDVDPVLTVLWGQVSGDQGWGNDHGKPRAENPNNNSVVLRVDYGQASVLITGDLEEVAIDDMLKRCAGTSLLDVDVYECGHHGSINGTTQELVDALSPAYAVACVGSPDREVDWTAWDYGHPRREVVDMLTAAITAARPSIDVRVGRKGHLFEDRTITRAMYATAWDGTVVLEAGADGVFHVVQPSSGPAPGLVNINTASADALAGLPRIGPTKAQAIVTDRGANGAFATVDELDRVPGIGPATVEAIRALLTVGP